VLGGLEVLLKQVRKDLPAFFVLLLLSVDFLAHLCDLFIHLGQLRV